MKQRKMIFFFRLFAVIDVLFSCRFELQTYDKAGNKKADTKFDKQEILKTKL